MSVDVDTDVGEPEPPARRQDRGGRSVVAVGAGALLGVVTVVVGSIGIGRSFDYDEGVTYATFVTGGSVSRAFTEQLVFNNHQMFSVIQAVAWRIGLVGESAQRSLPVLCGAATVGLLTWWLARRRGVVAGVAAGLFLLLDPVYLAEFRNLRGYALSTLAALVAALATERSWHDHGRRWVALGAFAMFVGVTTHVYTVVPIVAVAAVTIVLGRLRLAHVVAWVVAAMTAVVVQLPLLDDARRTSEARGTRYRPDFVELAAEDFLGGRWSVVLISLVLLVVGLVSLGRRSTRHALAVAVAVGWVASVVLVLWQLVRPLDLYARFFVSLAPFLAAAIGVGAGALPRRSGVVPVVVAVVLLLPNLDRTLDRDPPVRDVAAVLDAVRAAGFEICASDPEPLAVYMAVPRAIAPAATDGPNSYGDCQVYAAVLGVGGAGRELATATFDDEYRLRSASIFATRQASPLVAHHLPGASDGVSDG